MDIHQLTSMVLAASAVFVFGHRAVAHGADGLNDGVGKRLHLPRVRPMTPNLRDALEEGIRLSWTLRDLVQRLQRSNVIVYILVEELPPHVDGQLRLATFTAGTRYLRVGVREDLPRREMIVVIGHELQHAVEVADHPDVIDSESLLTLYGSIGYRTSRGNHETKQARRVGDRVRCELGG